MSAHISDIRIYPIKALDPVVLSEVKLENFALEKDRMFAMVAEDGGFINGKRTGKVNQLKAQYNLAEMQVTLSLRDDTEKQTFELHEQNEALRLYLCDFFGANLALVRGKNGQFMDVPQKSSVTIVSTATLESLQKDMGSISLDELRLRFRSNIEISGVETFWEEKLFGDYGDPVHFRLGEVSLTGMGPRARCSVPPKDPFTGVYDKEFTKQFLASRTKSLPEESKLPQHKHLYHLAVDVLLPETEIGKSIKLGDTLEITAPIES